MLAEQCSFVGEHCSFAAAHSPEQVRVRALLVRRGSNAMLARKRALLVRGGMLAEHCSFASEHCSVSIAPRAWSPSTERRGSNMEGRVPIRAWLLEHGSPPLNAAARTP